MSHIPSSAMPHAQAHHAHPEPAPAAERHEPRADATPWIAVAIGGALTVGGALTAAWLLRGKSKPAKGRRGKQGKRGGGRRKANREATPDAA